MMLHNFVDQIRLIDKVGSYLAKRPAVHPFIEGVDAGWLKLPLYQLRARLDEQPKVRRYPPVAWVSNPDPMTIRRMIVGIKRC